MSDIHILFPTPVYQNIFNPIFSLESAIDFIRTLEFKQDYNVYDKPNGKTTDASLDVISYPELKFIGDWIDLEAYNFIKTLQIDCEFHTLVRTNSWVNLQEKGNYIHEHKHNNTQFSGVFYPKVPFDSGDICFTSSQDTWIDSNTEPKVTGFDDLNSRKKTFTPRQGMLLMFPAHLRHYVTASKSDDERLSISFDYNLN